MSKIINNIIKFEMQALKKHIFMKQHCEANNIQYYRYLSSKSFFLNNIPIVVKALENLKQFKKRDRAEFVEKHNLNGDSLNNIISFLNQDYPKILKSIKNNK